MAASIACICGYRGPSVLDADRDICPICHTPASAPMPVAPASTAQLPHDDLHIPCPGGHVLRVAKTMLGQRVVCPQCNVVFVLAADACVEHRRERESLQHERDARRARRWLARAIWAAVLVVLAFVTMIVASTVQR